MGLTPADRIAATLSRSDFISTRRGIVSTDDLRAFLPAYQAQVTMKEEQTNG